MVSLSDGYRGKIAASSIQFLVAEHSKQRSPKLASVTSYSLFTSKKRKLYIYVTTCDI